jgi:hypothetical protein
MKFMILIIDHEQSIRDIFSVMLEEKGNQQDLNKSSKFSSNVFIKMPRGILDIKVWKKLTLKGRFLPL